MTLKTSTTTKYDVTCDDCGATLPESYLSEDYALKIASEFGWKEMPGDKHCCRRCAILKEPQA